MRLSPGDPTDPRWSLRDVSAAAFFLTYLTVQVIVPMKGLTVPHFSRFSWKMYAAVARRTKEIGTLRVLGFGRLSILVAFLLESVAIALIGAAIGIVLSLPLNLVSTGTSNWVTFSEIAFNFRVTPDLMGLALAFGAAIGFVGSLFPSIRASRFKIVDALRA